MNYEVFWGVLIPFIGTAAGAGCVFFMKRKLGLTVQRALTGFAGGVMVAASIWSLIIPAMEQSESMGNLAFLPAVIGFWGGILFLLFLDRIIPHLHLNEKKAEGPRSGPARGHGGWCCVCRISVRFCGDHGGRGIGAFTWYCDTELPGGSDRLYAAPCGGQEQRQSICGWRAVRNGRTDVGVIDDTYGRPDHTCYAIPSQFCRRGYDVCCSGGTHSGNVCRRTL